jgi:hypothetical protein
MFLAALALPLVLAAGCRSIEADALYARRLPGPPDERDWADAVPLRLLPSGGAVHKPPRVNAAQEVDRDTVHRNSASCHHGPSAVSAFPVWLRAYHDARNLYLRLSWPDETADLPTRHWAWSGGSWRQFGGDGDGLALVFPAGGDAAFSCSLVCHLDDYTVSGGRFQESARMHWKADGMADLWLWRAGEGPRDLFLDRDGIRRDADGEPVRRGNSLAESSGGIPPEGGDGPVADAGGRPLPAGFRPVEGQVLPAWLPLSAPGEGSTMTARERRRDGLWEITFVRPLDTGDPRDVPFAPGGSYPFSLSVLDDTLRNHHVVDRSWLLKLLN